MTENHVLPASRRTVISALKAATSSLALVATFAAPLAAQQTLIHAGQFYDVERGRVRSNIDILVRDDRIIEVGANLKPSGDVTEIDLSGLTVMPGLIDAHSHIALMPDYVNLAPVLDKPNPYRSLEALAGAQKALMAGFTTLRDVDNEGADMADIAVRDFINSGQAVGPRMFVSGWAISITGGHMNLTGLRPTVNRKLEQLAIIADSDDERIFAIRDQIKTGVDFIKIYATGTLRHIDRETMEPLSQLSVAEVQLMVDEARRWGKDVASHAYGGAGAYNSVAGGVRSIEHGMFLDDRTLDLMVKKGTYWCPTMTAYFPGENADAATRAFLTEITVRHKATFKKAMKKGVKIVFGTDIGALEHGDGWRELELMASYGMSPKNVLKSATTTGAALLNRQNDLGKIAPGYLADIIAVRGRPDRDISAMRNVEFVMVGGKIAKAIGE